ncbi:MAG: (Fe-S)-binding protein [Desulfarculaceae bacterium]|nr:(Fe-S)-binding protein [Desulfarculaceae bacterium]MCF8072682.1 (Fe-S)-binding protein [Desulfarculaceae bacterium]MCF8102561.1 (Fe-S)-binding protein [Desulfarculaceae bacterium]MCF8116470.1 (Fe-S)-binding protein [Desulfarculaceae bacterium]
MAEQENKPPEDNTSQQAPEGTEPAAPQAEAPPEQPAPEAPPAGAAPPEAPAQEPAAPQAAAPAPPPPEPEPEPTAVVPIQMLEAKRLLQLEACTRCGECLSWCPVYDQDGRQDILPRAKAAEVLRILKGQHGLLAKIVHGGGDPGPLRKLVGKLFGYQEVTREQIEQFARDLYECSTCGQCQIVCPAGLDTVNLWEEIRAAIVAAGYGPLEAQQGLVKSVKSYDNPWQQPRTARAKWARRAKKEKLIADVPKDITKKPAKVLLYLGCTASYDTNVRQVAISTVNILDALGIDYGILGNKERCCGSVMLRMGDREFDRIARDNIEQFNSLGAEILVTSCAGCFKTIREDYERVGELNLKVMHSAQFLRTLIESGELSFTTPVNQTVTYHDPCHLGRASRVYDDPRFIMEHIPGLTLNEMPRNREYSRCCGAGGGLKAGYPDVQNKMAQARVREAEETGASELVSCCPFCYQGLQVGINAVDSNLVARDLTALVEVAMGLKPPAEE